VTLEATADADKWVQLTWDVINASYPHQDEPAARLKRHGIRLPELVEVSGNGQNETVNDIRAAGPARSAAGRSRIESRSTGIQRAGQMAPAVAAPTTAPTPP
jgi:hypothetical protein